MIENNIICSKCVMDTSDPNIKFNDHGICDHCINFDNNIHDKWKENIKDSKELSLLAKKIKKQGCRRSTCTRISGSSSGTRGCFHHI